MLMWVGVGPKASTRHKKLTNAQSRRNCLLQERTHQLVIQYQMVGSKNKYTNDIIQTKQVMIRNIQVYIYIHIYIYIYAEVHIHRDIYRRVQKESIGGCEGRKRKEQMIQLNYNFKNKRKHKLSSKN